MEALPGEDTQLHNLLIITNNTTGRILEMSIEKNLTNYTLDIEVIIMITLMI